MSFRFPEGFVWGTATAAHQVEGNNVNSDFWLLEHTPGTLFAEPSGDACDHFHRYPRRHRACCAQLGFSAYRFSIEWARIEPEEGHFSVAALDHYRRMLACCHEHGVLAVRDLSSLHLAALVHRRRRLGGSRATSTASCATASAPSRHLGDLIGTAYTINEANLMATLAVSGVLPRDGLKSRGAVRRRGGAALRHRRSSASARSCSAHPMKHHATPCSTAHVRARDVLKSRPRRRFPSASRSRCRTTRRCPAARRSATEARAESFDPFLEAARARRLRRRADLQPASLRRRRAAAARSTACRC